MQLPFPLCPCTEECGGGVEPAVDRIRLCRAKLLVCLWVLEMDCQSGGFGFSRNISKRIRCSQIKIFLVTGCGQSFSLISLLSNSL